MANPQQKPREESKDISNKGQNNQTQNKNNPSQGRIGENDDVQREDKVRGGSACG